MENDELTSKIVSLFRESNEKFIKNDLIPFLRIPSNSYNQEGILKAKDFIISYITDFSNEIKEIKGLINPLILAKVEGELDGKLLIYMMYDTQPINKDEIWYSEPFGAEIKVQSPPLDTLGNCIIARGAYNSKTPLMCFLNAIKILKENDDLPISLLLVFDGEEEIGSSTLLETLDNNTNIFKNCNDAYYPSAKQNLAGNSVLKLGYKGILSLTIKTSTKNKEPHSSFSAMIPNPAVDLISLLNTLYSNNEFQIASLRNPYIPSKEEDAIIDELMKKIDIQNIMNKAGITHLNRTNSKEAFINYLFKSTFNISTLKSGFLEKGTKNYVPSHALCNIDIRFAHDITIDEIFNEIKEKVDDYAKKSKSHIELVKNIGYEGSRVSKKSILTKSLIKSVEILGYHTAEIWPLSPAAAPLSKIQKKLGINFISGGLGIGGFAHSANEFIQLDSIINARIANYYFLKIYAELVKKSRF